MAGGRDFGVRSVGGAEIAVVFALIVGCCVGLWAAWTNNWSVPQLGPFFTLGLGWVATVSVFGLFSELRNGEKPEVRTHWGGLGGGLGGWSMSPALVYLALALLFGGGAFVTLQTTADAQAKHDTAMAALVKEAATAAETAKVAAVAARDAAVAAKDAGDAAKAKKEAQASQDAAAKSGTAAAAASTAATGAQAAPAVPAAPPGPAPGAAPAPAAGAAPTNAAASQ